MVTYSKKCNEERKLRTLILLLSLLFTNASTNASEQTFTINNSLKDFTSSEKIKGQINILNQLVDDIYSDGIRFSYNGSKTTVNEWGQNYFILNGVSISLKKEIYEKYRKYHTFNDSNVLFNEVIEQYGDYWIFLIDEKDCCKGKLKIYIELLDSNNNMIARDTIRVADQAGNSRGGLTFRSFFNTIDKLETKKLAAKDISLLETNYNAFTEDLHFRLPIEDIKRIKYVKFKVAKI
jgi:hypothetical protein